MKDLSDRSWNVFIPVAETLTGDPATLLGLRFPENFPHLWPKDTHTLMKRWLGSQTQPSLFFYFIFKLWATLVALNMYVWLRSACSHSSLWNSNHVPEKSSEKRKPAGICSAIFRKCIKKVKISQVQCHKKQKHLKWKISPQTDPPYLLKKTWCCFKIVWSDSRTKQRVRLPRRRNVWSPAGRV